MSENSEIQYFFESKNHPTVGFVRNFDKEALDKVKHVKDPLVLYSEQNEDGSFVEGYWDKSRPVNFRIIKDWK